MTTYRTTEYDKRHDAEAEREHGPDDTLETYYDDNTPPSEIQLTTNEREDFEIHSDTRLLADVLSDESFTALLKWLRDEAALGDVELAQCSKCHSMIAIGAAEAAGECPECGAPNEGDPVARYKVRLAAVIAWIIRGSLWTIIHLLICRCDSMQLSKRCRRPTLYVCDANGRTIARCTSREAAEWIVNTANAHSLEAQGIFPTTEVTIRCGNCSQLIAVTVKDEELEREWLAYEHKDRPGCNGYLGRLEGTLVYTCVGCKRTFVQTNEGIPCGNCGEPTCHTCLAKSKDCTNCKEPALRPKREASVAVT